MLPVAQWSSFSTNQPMHHGSVRDFALRVLYAHFSTFASKSGAYTSGNLRQEPFLSPSILRTPSRLKLSKYGVRPASMTFGSDQLPIDVKPHARMRRCWRSMNFAFQSAP